MFYFICPLPRVENLVSAVNIKGQRSPACSDVMVSSATWWTAEDMHVQRLEIYWISFRFTEQTSNKKKKINIVKKLTFFFTIS